jgi:aspartate-semialdehyde dehydrogenase
MVGQRFVELLDKHPFLQIHAIGASDRSAGKSYAEATARTWRMETVLPPRVGAMTVTNCDASNFVDCDVVFSGLDSSVAGSVGKLCRGFALWVDRLSVDFAWRDSCASFMLLDLDARPTFLSLYYSS